MLTASVPLLRTSTFVVRGMTRSQCFGTIHESPASGALRCISLTRKVVTVDVTSMSSPYNWPAFQEWSSHVAPFPALLNGQREGIPAFLADVLMRVTPFKLLPASFIQSRGREQARP